MQTGQTVPGVLW